MSALPDATRVLLDRIAELLQYPGIGYEDKIVTALDLGHTNATDVLGDAPAAGDLAEAARSLAGLLTAKGKHGAEEHFTVLFDLSPVCTLNVGHHLFGDAYQRGELLAGLVGEMAQRGISIDEEIPDHLPLLLQLLGRVEDEDDRTVLASAVLLPGLERINDSLAENETPWSDILRVLPDVIQILVPDAVSMIDLLPKDPESKDPIGYQEVLPRA